LITNSLRLISVTVLVCTFLACGTGEPDLPLERVVDDARIFTVQELRTAGMKTSKQYDVSDLPEGVDAWYGFIKTDRGPMDIEVRFYANHADAVSFGTALAEEVSGVDADVDEETTTWLVGVKDRVRMKSGGTADLAAWSGQRRPNYADFVIFGNIVLLCQGDEPRQSVVVCHELIASLSGS